MSDDGVERLIDSIRVWRRPYPGFALPPLWRNPPGFGIPNAGEIAPHLSTEPPEIEAAPPQERALDPSPYTRILLKI